MGGVGDSSGTARIDKRTLPRSAAWRANIRASVCRRAGKPTFSDAEVIAAYRLPLSLRRTAEKFGITHERVRQILLANGAAVHAPYASLTRKRP